MHNLKTATLAAGFVSCVVLGAVAAPAIPNGTPIDEKYRKKFAECDSNNVFDGVHFPIYRNKERRKPNGIHASLTRVTSPDLKG